MKKNLKILFIAVLTLLFAQNCFAKEDIKANITPHESYLVLLEIPAETAMCSNTNMLSAEVLTTLYNEKNQILVKTLSEGIVRLYIATKNDVAVVEFTIKPPDIEGEDSYIEPQSEIIKSIIKIDKITEKSKKTEQPKAYSEHPPELRGTH